MVRDYVLGKLRRLGAILWRIRRGVDKMIIHKCLPFPVKPQCDELKLERLGTDYGGWTVPVDLLNENSICYCVGVGIFRLSQYSALGLGTVRSYQPIYS